MKIISILSLITIISFFSCEKKTTIEGLWVVKSVVVGDEEMTPNAFFLGEVYAAPNVYEGQVLVTTEAGELISLDVDSGEQNWLFEIEAPDNTKISELENEACSTKRTATPRENGYDERFNGTLRR